MSSPNEIITLKPVHRLLNATGKNYITAGEYREMLATLVAHTKKRHHYEELLKPLADELFGKVARVSKEYCAQRLDERLRAAQYHFQQKCHESLCPRNRYYPPRKWEEYYDLAYYNSTAPLADGHGHYDDEQKSTFYMRYELSPNKDSLLVGNLQASPLKKTSHPLWQRQNLKKLMVQLAIQEAQERGCPYITFQSGDSLVIAQNWDSTPSKYIMQERKFERIPEKEIIDETNLAYHAALRDYKIQLLQKISPPAANLLIGQKEYTIIKKEDNRLLMKPAWRRQKSYSPLEILLELGGRQYHAKKIKKSRPEIKLTPEFENLPDLIHCHQAGDEYHQHAVKLSIYRKVPRVHRTY